MATRQVDSVTDTYATKLAKLIPAEVSAGYLAINSLVPITNGFSLVMIASLCILTILCPAYLWLQGVRNVWQISFTTACFPVWALNISAVRSAFLDATTLGVILILITVTAPLIPTKTGT